jgi:biotin carboxylase
MRKNIFVLGLDEGNVDPLRHMLDAEHYRFHQLLTVDELQAGEIDLPGLLDRAKRQLRTFDGSIDAIVGYWDFPISSMVPMLCARFGLRSANLEAVVRCEHKYWSRLEQRAVVDEVCPRFAIVDLDTDDKLPEGLRYPVWLKPVKSFSSELAFCARDDEEFADAVGEIRQGIDRLGDPFEFVVEQVDAPVEVAEVGGSGCLAEESISGAQLTVEGYNDGDDVHIYGVVDTIPYPGTSSFLRYEYPSTLPPDMLARASSVARRVIKRIGLESIPFNIEFFADRDADELSILEINPRHSQSHAWLFWQVEGLPNHEVMLDLALDRPVKLPRGHGAYDCAAKWFVRRFGDGVVTRVPSDDEIAAIQEEIPGTEIVPEVAVGDRLLELRDQDSYSYKIAHVFVAAADPEELENKYERCLERLPFAFDDPS